MVQVNLTPLIDVVFLLLIFFMVSTSFTRENQLQINLPEASAQEETESASFGLTLTIQESGSYAIDGQVLAANTITVLMEALQLKSGGDTDQPLMIVADANATHQAVVTAMDAAGRLGFVNLRISTQEPKSE